MRIKSRVIRDNCIENKLVRGEYIERGSKIINSTSKIRKITVIRKNWVEKGNRDFFFWSNPHSNGVILLR